MGIEIERKFLVRDPSIVAGCVGTPMRQGYLSRAIARTVRVRVAGDRGWLTVKGRTTGPSRPEFEYEIPAADALAILELADGPVLEKTRYRIASGPRTWEVDVFGGANDGLVTAEIELEAVDADVELPDWLGDEVTGDPRYANSALASVPVSVWPPAGEVSAVR